MPISFYVLEIYCSPNALNEQKKSEQSFRDWYGIAEDFDVRCRPFALKHIEITIYDMGVK
jgi:hypothetical protein